MRWRSIRDDPPPEGERVWITNGRAFCLATRMMVGRGKKKESQWNFGTWLMHDADRWCGRKEFEEAVMPDGMPENGLQLQPVR